MTKGNVIDNFAWRRLLKASARDKFIIFKELENLRSLETFMEPRLLYPSGINSFYHLSRNFLVSENIINAAC